MIEKYLGCDIELEQMYSTETSHETARKIERTVRSLAKTAINAAAIERVPRYTSETRENDAEHSFMLSLIAPDIAAEYYPDLDAGLVAQLANVHDLLELKTGDVATFAIEEATYQEKNAREHAALDELCEELPPYTALLLRIYEEQQLPEARLVRLLDKLLPLLVNIEGTGSQVMHEDYGILTRAQLDRAESDMKKRFETMFPDQQLIPMHITRNNLARQFSELFVPAESEQLVLF